jgi:hypothetical protein
VNVLGTMIFAAMVVATAITLMLQGRRRGRT